MAVPQFETLMKPTLEILSDGKIYPRKELESKLAQIFNLTEKDLAETLKTNNCTRFESNANWARTYMKQAGLITYPERGKYQITELGKQELQKNPEIINKKYLYNFPNFVEFQNRRSDSKKQSPSPQSLDDSNPEEVADEAISQINDSLAEDLLTEIMKIDHYRFEQMVVDLLIKMGYGRPDDSYATVSSGDGGVDGILNEDKLGFSKIFVQAKHWERNMVVGRPELQRFKGAITGKTDKGVFITTGHFSSEAKEYAKESQIILIDGDRLADIMIEYNFCISPRKTYEIKALDTDLLNDYQN